MSPDDAQTQNCYLRAIDYIPEELFKFKIFVMGVLVCGYLIILVLVWGYFRMGV
jgi:hypothetical protein